MVSTRTKLVGGHITVVQEQRFRLVNDAGQGMLFTLAHDASASQSDLSRFHKSGAHVLVEYTGEPDLSSGGAHAVRASI